MGSDRETEDEEHKEGVQVRMGLHLLRIKCCTLMNKLASQSKKLMVDLFFHSKFVVSSTFSISPLPSPPVYNDDTCSGIRS